MTDDPPIRPTSRLQLIDIAHDIDRVERHGDSENDRYAIVSDAFLTRVAVDLRRIAKEG